MKVGDYVNVGDNVLYLKEDITKEHLGLLEFKALVIYTKNNDDLDLFVGKVCILSRLKDNPMETVTPIFVKDEK